MPEAQLKPTVRLQAISPQFTVPDVVAAAEYYRDKLGFTIRGYWFDPPVFAIVTRDSVNIQLGRLDPGRSTGPNACRREEGLDAYVWVTDVDALFTELQQRGAKIVEAPTHREWKCYEMVVEDFLGFRLCFAQDTSSVSA